MKFEKDYSPDGEEKWLAWGVGFTGNPAKAEFTPHEKHYVFDSLRTTLWVRKEAGGFDVYPLCFHAEASWKMRERLKCRTALIEIHRAKARPSENLKAGFSLHVFEPSDVRVLCRIAFNPARLPFSEFLKEFEELIRTGQVPIN